MPLTTTEHLLAKLIEECAEAQKFACKALEFGLDSDFDGRMLETNKVSLEREIDDIEGVLALMRTLKIVREGSPAATENKIGKLHYYMDIARNKRLLVDVEPEP